MKKMTKDDKIKILENIKSISKNKNFNLGDLEENILGLSRGYFARLISDLKADKNDRPLPPLDTFVLVADYFKLPLNRLIEVDATTLNERQFAIMNFVDSLSSDTNNRKFIWRRIGEKTLKGEKLLNLNENPLFVDCVDEAGLQMGYFDTEEEATFRKYKSKFIDSDGIYVEDDAFTFSYGKLSFLLVKVEFRTGSNNYHDNTCHYFELYSIKEGKFIPFAYTTSADSKEFNKCFEDLYEAARLSAKENPTGDDIIDMINDYTDYFKNRENIEKNK